ncbi:MAG: tryptophan synthase subunit alpha [Puniceicoccales bacterium]|jgi:tryptophan synthase alpha chain|nr:tryptophan synthase subunit alpha [Puniceicoccales bacterium]
MSHSKDRIADAFQLARNQGRAAFIAYICGGDPDFETSVAVAIALLDAGVDILEIGVPFSDPLADGLTNQLAAQRALAGGMTHERLFALVRRIREKSDKPIILYAYYNLIFSQGVVAAIRRFKEAGVDGILTLDCPPEEAGELLAASRDAGLANIFIVAPTTPPERIARIARDATGFIYYVSREGVTGVRSDLASGIGAAVAAIKQHTTLPVAVGFGISTAAHVAAVGRVADGVVVGSALVNIIAAHTGEREKLPAELAAKVRALTGGAAG